MIEFIIQNPWTAFYYLGALIAFLWSAFSDSTIEDYDPFTNIFTWCVVALFSWLGIFYSLVLKYHKYKKAENVTK